MKKILFFLLFIFSSSAYSQVAGMTEKDLLGYRLKVKQLDEFMRRFNQQEIPSLFHNKDSLQQAVYSMTAVFDYNVIKHREQDVCKFVTTMLENKVQINFTDSIWKAVAHCIALYKGKEIPLTIELATENVKDCIYKWVITDAYGDVLNLTPLKQNPGLAISPVDNEVNFVSLKHITTVESRNILNFKERCSNINTLSVFFALVNSGQLQILSRAYVYARKKNM